MKKTISLKVKETVKKDFEVEFPIFSEHAMDHSTVYRRIEEDGRNWAITEWFGRGESHYEIETSERFCFDTSDPDYLLGRGIYSSSPNEFMEVVKKMKGILDEVPDV